MVRLVAVSPQRFSGLPASPGAKLRVRAQASGSQVPASPTFSWRVTHGGQPVAFTPVGGDPAVVEFPTEMVGQYLISVELLGVSPTCAAGPIPASAQPPNNLVARYRIRAIAPAARELAPLETDITVSMGSSPTKTLELTRGLQIQVAAVDERQVELPQYLVQLRSRSSTVRLEGFVDTSVGTRRNPGFRARLDVGHSHRYDLLVIPSPGAGNGIRAPRLYPGVLADQIELQDFVMDPGVRVVGTVQTAAGPLAAARVRLRSGLLTSTIGDTGAAGGYELRARAGRFEVRILPPVDSGLPEAQLPESSGVIHPRQSAPRAAHGLPLRRPASHPAGPEREHAPGRLGRPAGRRACGEPGGRAGQRGQLRPGGSHGAGHRDGAHRPGHGGRRRQLRTAAPGPLPDHHRPARGSGRRSGHHQPPRSICARPAPRSPDRSRW